MDSALQTADAVATQLNISAEQLRRWTKDYAAQLSAAAVGSGYYRYSTEDVRRLYTVRDLLGQGKSIEEVTNHLAPTVKAESKDQGGDQPPAHAQVEPPSPAALVIQPDEGGAQGAGAMVLREVLTGFAAGQEAILNSQQANRNLMGVVIQDNFNLKEENARLRERMLKLEQELNEVKRQQAEQRRQFDQRFRQLEQKRDWLSRLLG